MKFFIALFFGLSTVTFSKVFSQDQTLEPKIIEVVFQTESPEELTREGHADSNTIKLKFQIELPNGMTPEEFEKAENRLRALEYRGHLSPADTSELYSLLFKMYPSKKIEHFERFLRSNMKYGHTGPDTLFPSPDSKNPTDQFFGKWIASQGAMNVFHRLPNPVIEEGKVLKDDLKDDDRVRAAAIAFGQQSSSQEDLELIASKRVESVEVEKFKLRLKDKNEALKILIAFLVTARHWPESLGRDAEERILAKWVYRNGRYAILFNQFPADSEARIIPGVRVRVDPIVMANEFFKKNNHLPREDSNDEFERVLATWWKEEASNSKTVLRQAPPELAEKLKTLGISLRKKGSKCFSKIAQLPNSKAPDSKVLRPQF
ncbi:MAG: hypothetical protein JWQ35_967 [Bacteriovoracaceae bacterium]|nr:hypothetical protein [Bacteriovoracaceae bacterium]